MTSSLFSVSRAAGQYRDSSLPFPVALGALEDVLTRQRRYKLVIEFGLLGFRRRLGYGTGDSPLLLLLAVHDGVGVSNYEVAQPRRCCDELVLRQSQSMRRGERRCRG